jgi:NAD(P)H-dependent flavin oxidoreductase YrpB (nitropropane dioxygenase family)
MEITPLCIGNRCAKLPIVQGGMGVGISLSGLAGAVAAAGGIGTISGVEIGFNWPGYRRSRRNANREAMLWHLAEARRIAPEGVIGVNIMVALTDYEQTVAAAIDGGADIIFSGAGLPLSLPALAEGSDVKLVPIISSAKAASLLVRNWRQKHGRTPDGFVLEGPLAGGHLGFTREQIEQAHGDYALEKLLAEVLAELDRIEARVPVIAGGGLYHGSEAARLLAMGASGVQIGTRFVTTKECDAPAAFKQAYLDASEEDIVIIQSPVGMPGRALSSEFIKSVQLGEKNPTGCMANCIKSCGRQAAPYCIAQALMNAAKGNLKDGFTFVGSRVHLADTIVPVKDLMENLHREIADFQLPEGIDMI